MKMQDIIALRLDNQAIVCRVKILWGKDRIKRPKAIQTWQINKNKVALRSHNLILKN